MFVELAQAANWRVSIRCHHLFLTDSAASMVLGLDQSRADFVWATVFAGWNLQWFWASLVACLLSAALSAVLVRIAPKRGWVVVPGDNRWSQRVVAQFGGIPILFVAFGVLPFLQPRPAVLNLVLPIVGIALLGFIDDMIGLGPKPKLLIEFLLAGLAVHAGVVSQLTHVPSFNALLTVLWIVAITNAFNLIDNIDGLAVGVAVIALLQIVLLAGLRAPIAAVALCLLSSMIGFLFFNLHPAKVFMGDVGSLPIGFFLACASVTTASHLSSLGSVLLVPCLVLFIPIFDMLLVSVTRRLNGRAISRGARDHASHRLVLLGLTEPQAVSILYAVAFIAGVLAFCWERFWPDWGAGFLSLFLILAALFWLYLAKLELPESWLSESRVVIINVPAFFLRALAKLSMLVLDATIIILGLYFACLSDLASGGRVFLAHFWLAAAASVLIKLIFLTASGTYRGRWTLSRLRDIYPVLKGVFLAACLISAGWILLSDSYVFSFPIISVDAAFTSMLLLLARASMQFFDYALGALRALPGVRHSSSGQQLPNISAPGSAVTHPTLAEDVADKWEM